MELYDIILTDSDNTVGRQIARCLQARGLRVLSLPGAMQEGLQARMIIPVFWPERLSSSREKQTLLLLDSKEKVAALAAKLGILCPKRYRLSPAAGRDPLGSAWEDLFEGEVPYGELVVKRDGGHGGDSVYFPTSQKAFRNILAKSTDWSELLVTDFIDGYDICTDAIRWGDYFQAHSYRVHLPHLKGISLVRESILAPQQEAQFQALLSAVDYKGVCGADWRICSKTGRAYLLECNPRFSGGICSQIAAGFPTPWLLWQLANGMAPDPVAFKEGVITKNAELSRLYLEKRRRKGKLTDYDTAAAALGPVARYDDILWNIRHATVEDLPQMLQIFEAAKGIMRSDGNLTQWTGSYPGAELLLSEIERGVSYIMYDDSGWIGGCFSFIPGKDPTYAVIYDGAWLDDEAPYGTIHRLASYPHCHGIAQACFDWCFEQIPNLRVDTHADNRIMQHCIEKAGFSHCGTILLSNGDPRLAYQKI